MRKILISGMTGANVRGQLVRTEVYTQSHCYGEGLKKLGCEIERRPPDEDFPHIQSQMYDQFLIGLAPIGSITAGWRLPCLALIGHILLSGKKIVTFIDDWQFQSIMPNLENLSIDGKIEATFGRDVKMGRLKPDFYEREKDNIQIGLNYILSKEHVMLSSIMDFGHSNDPYYELSNNPIFLDPSVYQPIPNFPTNIRYKQWVIAGLADYTNYVASLKCSWPVKHVGQKVNGKFQSQKESEVFLAYSMSKGMLIPMYKSSNTNWWRPRYLFARKFGNVIYSMPGSTGSYRMFNVDIETIETSDHIFLKELIQSQQETLDNIIWPEEKFLSVLGSVFGINSYYARTRGSSENGNFEDGIREHERSSS